MKRWIRITLKILAAGMLLIVLAWIAGAIYITRNKEAILESILAQLNKNIHGKVTAGSMEPALLKGFPGVSVTLSKVLLRDSLWQVHHHDLLNAEQLNVSLNVLSLIAGNTKINRIAIKNASVHLYTDSTGYSNTSLFKSNDEKKKTSNTTPDIEIRNIDFSNVRFTVENLQRLKHFDFLIDDLSGRIQYPSGGTKGTIQLKTLVRSFAFNTRKGSFLKDKELSGKLEFQYEKKNKTIVIEPNRLNIGKDVFNIGAHIQLDKAAFSIDIAAEKILYKDIALLLSPNISEKLLRFSVDKPISVKGTIVDDGTGRFADPLIQVEIKANASTVKIPSGQLDAASFEGSFTNRLDKEMSIGDENSAIHFYRLKGNYYNVPIRIDTFSINNLERPIATGRILASFPLSKLNSSVDDDVLTFKSGTADVNIYCKTDIDNFRFTKPLVNGTIRVKDADITYLPRKMHLVKSALTLVFTETDLTLKNSRFQLGNSILNMDCQIRNFLNLYYTAPEKILVDLRMRSPQLYLNEFLPFLGPRNQVKRTTRPGNSMKAFTEQLGTVLEASKMKIRLNVDKALYKKFLAKNLAAEIDLVGSDVYLQKISLQHAGGSLNVSGNIQQAGNKNRFTLKSTITRVNVKEFFNAFDNFGQTSITDNNLRGYLSSVVLINGFISDAGSIAPKSINGTVNFNLKDAALINFEPMEQAGKFAFANRNFSDIRLPNLDGFLTIRGEKIEISPMQLSSSVLNMDLQGTYSMGAGTNIQMDIPLRNPEKDAQLSAAERKKSRMKGIVLHLKAIDGENGKVKIRWNGGKGGIF